MAYYNIFISICHNPNCVENLVGLSLNQDLDLILKFKYLSLAYYLSQQTLRHFIQKENRFSCHEDEVTRIQIRSQCEIYLTKIHTDFDKISMINLSPFLDIESVFLSLTQLSKNSIGSVRKNYSLYFIPGLIMMAKLFQKKPEMSHLSFKFALICHYIIRNQQNERTHNLDLMQIKETIIQLIQQSLNEKNIVHFSNQFKELPLFCRYKVFIFSVIPKIHYDLIYLQDCFQGILSWKFSLLCSPNQKLEDDTRAILYNQKLKYYEKQNSKSINFLFNKNILFSVNSLREEIFSSTPWIFLSISYSDQQKETFKSILKNLSAAITETENKISTEKMITCNFYLLSTNLDKLKNLCKEKLNINNSTASDLNETEINKLKKVPNVTVCSIRENEFLVFYVLKLLDNIDNEEEIKNILNLSLESSKKLNLI